MNYEAADRIELIKACTWGIAFTAFWLCALIYGIAWFAHVEVTAEDIYARRNMSRNIEALEHRVQSMEIYATEILELKQHVHRYYDGGIK